LASEPAQGDGQEAGPVHNGVDDDSGPGVFRFLHDVGLDKENGNEGDHHLPAEGHVEQPPAEAVDQPGMPSEGDLLARQHHPPPEDLLAHDIQYPIGEPNQQQPIPVAVQGREGHEGGGHGDASGQDFHPLHQQSAADSDQKQARSGPEPILLGHFPEA